MQSLRRALTRRITQTNENVIALSQQVMSFATVTKGEGSGDNKLQLILKALEPQVSEDVEHTPEELAEAAKRAKEYSRLKMRQHRQWQADLSTKLKLKQAAIEALPPDLREAAMVPDDTLFPSNRYIWTVTPPRFEDNNNQENSGTETSQKTKQRGTKRSLGTKMR